MSLTPTQWEVVTQAMNHFDVLGQESRRAVEYAVEQLVADDRSDADLRMFVKIIHDRLRGVVARTTLETTLDQEDNGFHFT